MAAAAVELLFCLSDSCGRNNCCPPGQEELSRVGRGCREVRFPKPFLFNSRIFSKMSKYSTSMRTRNQSELHQTLPKQSDFLDDEGFTDLGVKPEVFTKEKIPILVNWIFCLNKILKIEPKCR